MRDRRWCRHVSTVWRPWATNRTPCSAKIGWAKLLHRTAEGLLRRIEAAIEAGLDRPRPLTILAETPRKFLSSLFLRPALESLLGARESLRQHGSYDDDLAFLVLSKVIDRSSHSQTDGIYKTPASRKVLLNPRRRSGKSWRKFGPIWTPWAKHALRQAPARIIEKSSEEMIELSDGCVGIVVTSPPYLNNFDFAEMTRMLLYFWGIPNSWGEITEKVRAKLVVNTTTALAGRKPRQDAYRVEPPRRLETPLRRWFLSRPKSGVAGPARKNTIACVYPYFAQITAIFRECHRCMAGEAPLHIMVADAALYGVHVSPAIHAGHPGGDRLSQGHLLARADQGPALDSGEARRLQARIGRVPRRGNQVTPQKVTES